MAAMVLDLESGSGQTHPLHICFPYVNFFFGQLNMIRPISKIIEIVSGYMRRTSVENPILVALMDQIYLYALQFAKYTKWDGFLRKISVLTVPLSLS